MSAALYPRVPDERSLRDLLAMGYAMTRWGAAWPGNGGWEQPNGQTFPLPALLIEIPSRWRPNGPLALNTPLVHA